MLWHCVATKDDATQPKVFLRKGRREREYTKMISDFQVKSVYSRERQNTFESLATDNCIVLGLITLEDGSYASD